MPQLSENRLTLLHSMRGIFCSWFVTNIQICSIVKNFSLFDLYQFCSFGCSFHIFWLVLKLYPLLVLSASLFVARLRKYYFSQEFLAFRIAKHFRGYGIFQSTINN